MLLNSKSLNDPCTTACLIQTPTHCQSPQSLSQSSPQSLGHPAAPSAARPSLASVGHLHGLWCEPGTVAVALDEELMGVVGQAIERRVSQDRVIEQAEPLVDRAVRGHDEAAMAVPLDDQLVQVLAVLAREAPQAEVVHDQQLRGQVAAERWLEGRRAAAARCGLIRPL